MSRIRETIDEISAVAFKVTLAQLAKEAGVNVDTARRILKTPPKQITALMKLEAAAAKHRVEEIA